MTNRFLTGPWLGRATVLMLAASTVGGASGCSKKHEEEASTEKVARQKHNRGKHKEPPSDRYADRRRLNGALKEWRKRWSRIGELPACEPLLKTPSELALCKNTVAALSAVKAAVAKPESEATVIHLTAELAYAAQVALEKLSEASEKVHSQHPAAPASSVRKTVAATPSAAPSAAETPVDPATQVLESYSRLERTSRRYLSQFLQFGPFALRKATFKELEALSQRKEAWWGLGHSVHEATLTETDQDLKRNLTELAAKLRQRPPGPSAKNPEPVADADGAPPAKADKK